MRIPVAAILAFFIIGCNTNDFDKASETNIKREEFIGRWLCIQGPQKGRVIRLSNEGNSIVQCTKYDTKEEFGWCDYYLHSYKGFYIILPQKDLQSKSGSGLGPSGLEEAIKDPIRIKRSKDGLLFMDGKMVYQKTKENR